MFSGYTIGFLHFVINWLLHPVIWALMAVTVWALIEIGVLLAEYFQTLPGMRSNGDICAVEHMAKRRIDHCDFLARIAPMLGLMGTLIPLGPGLAALGEGELTILSTAVSVAFDTTVLGLLVGIAGFVMGRLRRRWYDELLTSLETKREERGS